MKFIRDPFDIVFFFQPVTNEVVETKQEPIEFDVSYSNELLSITFLFDSRFSTFQHARWVLAL